jgi:hypothetical protein
MRSVIYNGDPGELLAKYTGRWAGRDHECVALPQGVTSVGHTGRWRRGEKVTEQSYMPPGTVIANFKEVNGEWRFPCQHFYHAAIFLNFGPRKPSGGYTHFWVLDQWNDFPVARRNKNSWSNADMKRLGIKPADDADQYYIVLVP